MDVDHKIIHMEKQINNLEKHFTILETKVDELKSSLEFIGKNLEKQNEFYQNIIKNLMKADKRHDKEMREILSNKEKREDKIFDMGISAVKKYGPWVITGIVIMFRSGLSLP